MLSKGYEWGGKQKEAGKRESEREEDSDNFKRQQCIMNPKSNQKYFESILCPFPECDILRLSEQFHNFTFLVL